VHGGNRRVVLVPRAGRRLWVSTTRLMVPAFRSAARQGFCDDNGSVKGMGG
jgi:hypothetical protein